jgi:hypothetical protein
MNNRVSSASSGQILDVAISNSFNETDALYRKLFAVKAMPTPKGYVEAVLKTTILPGSKPIEWPNQLVQSILLSASRLSQNTSTLGKATNNDQDNLGRRVLELGLQNLRIIIELEFVVTNAGSQVEANRLLPGLLYFHNSFQDMLIMLDRILVKSGPVDLSATFVAVSLFFLIEHTTVRLCQHLSRTRSTENDDSNAVSQNDNAVATICTVARYALRRKISASASQEKAQFNQLGADNGTFRPVLMDT